MRGGRRRKGNGESFLGSISGETLFVGIEWAEVVVDRDLWLQRRGMRYSRPPRDSKERDAASISNVQILQQCNACFVLVCGPISGKKWQKPALYIPPPFYSAMHQKVFSNSLSCLAAAEASILSPF